MAKKVTGQIRLQIPAGAANPAPPIGPALGAAGCNIMEFCKQFNAATQAQSGTVIPVVITVYADRSFTFICKSPPAAVCTVYFYASTTSIPILRAVPSMMRIAASSLRALMSSFFIWTISRI